MTTPPSPSPPVTAGERIARAIRTEIESGRLTHGQHLPPIRELAKIYGASASTITRAIEQLVSDQLVITKARTAAVVNHPPTTADVPRQRPIVVLIGGYAGSGKTELGRILARQTHWPMMDKDSTTRAVVEAALTTLGLSPHDRSSETYLQVIRPAEYEALISGMEENLECGTSVIVTAPFAAEFADPAWCERIKARITSLGGTAAFVWLRCDDPTMHTYIRKRGAARDAAKMADWPAWVAGLDLHFAPATSHTIIDNSAGAPPLQQQAQLLLDPILKR
jgi:predicted kinase